MRDYYVYIITCADDSFYTGITNSVKARFDEHQAGFDPTCYTYTRRPLVLSHYERFSTASAAIRREKQLKGWSRAKKKALIEGNIPLLKELSKSHSQKNNPSSS